MSAPCPLGRCDGSGLVEDPVRHVVTECACRRQIVAGRRARSLSAVIPRRYRGVSFDRPPVTEMPAPQVDLVRRFVRHLGDRLAEGRGLWFQGGPGTGKTTLAMLVSRSALDEGRTVAIYSLPRLLAEIRETFDDDRRNAYTDLLDRLAAVDLLHLDDVGAEKTSPWVLEQLYALINARYEDERSVVITTNLTQEELAEQIGARTVSRLEEMCDIVPMMGRDRRRVEVVDQRDERPGRVGSESSGTPPDLRLA